MSVVNYVAYNLKTRMPWGKYKGHRISHIVKIDPQYLMWLSNNSSEFNLHDDVLIEVAALSLPKRNYTKTPKIVSKIDERARSAYLNEIAAFQIIKQKLE